MPNAALLLGLALFAATLHPGGTFFDDDANTHDGSIEAIAAERATVGCNPPSNDRFCRDDIVTRGEMAAFISRGKSLEPAPRHWFVDDNGHTLERYINRLAAAGMNLGCNPPDNDRFCPNDPVTRDQMATFLTRALGLTANTPPPRVHELVEIEPRETWGARTADTAQMVPHTVDRLTVHHAGSQTGTTGIAQIKGWQNFHLDGRGWGDIAYHLVIGIDGTVYEGRDRSFRGDTGTTYDTTGHFLVVVEGNFNVDRPTQAQIDSLVAVLAGAAIDYDVSPATITGHRDHAATSCPGARLGALIDSGEIQQRVESLIEAGGSDLIWP